MNETEEKTRSQEPKPNLLGVASLGFSLLGWLLLVVQLARLISEKPVEGYFRWCILLCWSIALVCGLITLARIKRQQSAHKQKITATLGIWIAAIPLSIMVAIWLISYFVWPEFPFPRQRPFSECDPNKVIDLIGKRFDFNLPDNIKSSRAVETRTTWLDPSYYFILNLTTNQDGWEQFHTSFPKIKDQDTRYIETDGREYIHDMYDFMDYDTPDHDPRTMRSRVPKWHKTKIKKGKYYLSHLGSKDWKLSINTLCVDLADPENIVIYIEGWGPYDPNYGLN